MIVFDLVYVHQAYDSLLVASDPFIYYHKWLFVADDYPGYDVAKSAARSRIGNKSYWEHFVVPRLTGQLAATDDGQQS